MIFMNGQMNDQQTATDTDHLPSTPVSTCPAWRTEPSISGERQQFLRQRLTIVPDIQQGIYPFKDVKLTRADIEWLLITHAKGRGPVDWNDVQQRGGIGLDLRGADLRRVVLRNLPLTRMHGGLT